MYGGAGNDIYYVEDTGNRALEHLNEGYDIVHATGVANFTLSANVERIIFDDTIDHVAKGNALDNRLNGNAGRDKFLIDEGGADIFSGGSSRDVFDARASTTGIKVYLNNQAANAGATAGDIFASIEVFSGSSTAGDTMRGGAGRSRFAGNGGDDILIGNNNIDFLQGGADNDTIYGGSGRDTLQGGSGDDLLDGGNARDQFLYVLENFGHDTIVDFEDGLDYFKIWSGNNPSNGVADDISDFTITGNGTSTVTVTLNSDPNSIITVNSFDGNAMTIDAGDFQFY
jgi:Ca2+-binding RTX toxin-like protein